MNRLFFSLCAGAVGCAFALPFPATAIAKSKLYTETVLYPFPSYTYPLANLIDVKGTLYGTTFAGGANGLGTVFSVNPKTGAETVLYSFGSSGTDGYFPVASLIDVKGTLYGTTEYGGTYGDGTVFSVNPKTGAETVVHSFGSGTDGSGTEANLIYVKSTGTLYGTTYAGGTNGDGTVFSLDLKTGAETVVYSFCSQANCADGEEPDAGLIDVNGTLYGTTFLGGTTGDICSTRSCGTVFALDPSSGTETVLYSFSGSGTGDGANPEASLLYMNGTLYGTTVSGGIYETGLGTLFSVDPTTGAETVLHSFGGTSDGISPVGNLIDVKGTLYGITFGGGNGNHGGTAYSINPTTGAENVIYFFCSQANCADGTQPDAGLIDLKGTFYGTTEQGGANDGGTVFALKKP
ncbi:MAG TPA: choice-of-anchor tandem repeat GloVer-containing protein [Rhizomicrobium sp.]|nr:choice-of-anchor tandem repeat GloVer-containing protein [Rhizomicrobium sp.]